MQDAFILVSLQFVVNVGGYFNKLIFLLCSLCWPLYQLCCLSLHNFVVYLWFIFYTFLLYDQKMSSNWKVGRFNFTTIPYKISSTLIPSCLVCSFIILYLIPSAALNSVQDFLIHFCWCSWADVHIYNLSCCFLF